MNTIPLEKIPSQTFRVSLENVFYRFRVRWNKRQQYFSLDILSDESVPLLYGQPMLKGSNIIEAFSELPIGGLFMLTIGDDVGEATLDNIGESVVLVHLTQEEVEAVKSGETI